MEDAKALAGLVLQNSKSTSEDVKYAKEYFNVVSAREKLRDKGFPTRSEDLHLAYLYKKLSKAKNVHTTVYNNSFRYITFRMLPTHLSSEILFHVDKHVSDSTYQPPATPILTIAEEQAINGYNTAKLEVIKLRQKILAVKRDISEVIPDLKGEMSPEEYKRRIDLIKQLSKVMRDLG